MKPTDDVDVSTDCEGCDGTGAFRVLGVLYCCRDCDGEGKVAKAMTRAEAQELGLACPKCGTTEPLVFEEGDYQCGECAEQQAETVRCGGHI